MEKVRKQWMLLEEAEKAGIPWKNWRDPVVQVGEWVRTDDDYVLYVKEVLDLMGSDGYPDRGIKTVFGIKNQMKSKECVVRETVDGIKVLSRKRRPNTKLRNDEKLFVDLVMGGEKPDRAMEVAFPQLNTKYRRKAFLTLLGRKSVVTYMADKLKESMENNGLDENYIISQLKSLVADAQRDSDKLDAIKLSLTLQGHLGKKIEKKTVKAALTFDEDDYDMLEGERTEETEEVGALTEVE